MKRILSLTLTIIILMLNANTVFAEANNKKTIIITLDEMDFEDAGKLINDNLSMGLLNIKTSGKNKESLFITIGTGRKVKIPDGVFTGLSRNNNQILVDNYDRIKSSLDKSYPNFSKQMSFLGTLLEDSDIKVSYIGDKNKSESLMIANGEGKIDYWEEKTPYKDSELEAKASEMLKVSDVLLISFDINNNENRLKVLSEFLNKMDNYRLIVFPKTVSGDLNYRLNDSIVPIFYSSNEAVGTITSKSTRRDSVITNLDLLPTIADYYDINIKSSIGNKIDILQKTDLIEVNKSTLLEFLNLNMVKYIFHGLVTTVFVYIAFMYKFKELNLKKTRILLNTVSLSIMISILLGEFHLHRSIVLYSFILIGLSLITSISLEKRDIKSIEMISAITNILILGFIFFKPTNLYNSFIGYNSIVAGGRFYGFNNEIMGVLIVTSIIVYYSVKDRIKDKKRANIFLMIYFPIVIIALTGNFGANFGGFLTSIAVFLILLYLSLFDREINKKTVLSLLAVGLFILIFNLYLDMKDESGSHAGDLIERINILGFYELVDMIIKKIKQLLYMMVMPPWNIGFLTQIYFVTCKFKDIKKSEKTVPIRFIVMFVASFIALLINDTGVVAFVYMNTYLIKNVLEER